MIVGNIIHFYLQIISTLGLVEIMSIQFNFFGAKKDQIIFIV